MVDFHTRLIENMLLFGDMEVSEPEMQKLLRQYSLFSRIRSPTRFTCPHGKCIELVLTNNKHIFFGNQIFETGFRDFHHMTYIILQLTYQKLSPRITKYRNYRKFSEAHFLNDLSSV